MSRKIRNKFRLQQVKDKLEPMRMPYSIAAFNTDKDINIGGLIRSSNAFLAEEFIYIGAQSFDWSPAVGAHRIENIRHFPTVEEFFEFAGREGRPVVCIEQHPRAVSITEALPPEHSILLLGQELLGTPDEIIEQAGMVIEIPQLGAVGSLNVAMSGTVVLYELACRYYCNRPPHPAPESWKPGGKPKRPGDALTAIAKRIEQKSTRKKKAKE